MAEPVSTAATTAAAPVALTALSAAANASDLVQALDSYLGLVDPASGCSLDLEAFALTRPKEPATKPPSDENRKLRVKGPPKSARSDTDPPAESKSPPYLRKIAELPLVAVTNEITKLDRALGERSDPMALLFMRAWEFDSSVACVPFLAVLSGFDSRIGNQVSFKCRAVPLGESAAAIITEVLYNPFGEESGFITTTHFVTLKDQLSLSFRDAVIDPSIFKGSNTWLGAATSASGYTVRPR